MLHLVYMFCLVWVLMSGDRDYLIIWAQLIKLQSLICCFKYKKQDDKLNKYYKLSQHVYQITIHINMCTASL
jgi:hypothetical protein